MKLWGSAIFLIFFSNAYAQETNRNQMSTVPSTARFEIVQSELAAKLTLKIDKHNGIVYQLVKGSSGDRWQMMTTKRPMVNHGTPGEINYQVFTSGLALRMTYLLNIHTGATWQLFEDSDIGMYWSAIR